MRMGSLFSGIGGIDLGFERAGYEIAWQVEIDPWCRKVLAKHFPHAERFNDVCECGAHNLSPVDVVAGGFPCQDISVAGLAAGINGRHSGLWREMARIVGELRPAFVLVENVAVLLGRGVERVCGDLAEIGYDAEWEIISAADVGAPHLRHRIWIVAYPQANAPCANTDDAGLHRAQVHVDQQAQLRNQQVGNAGSLGEYVAHSDGAGCEERRGSVAVEAQQRSAECCREALADTDSGGCEVERQSQYGEQSSAPGSKSDGCSMRRWGYGKEALADTAGSRFPPRACGESGEIRDQARRPEPERLGREMADTDSGRCEQRDADERRLPVANPRSQVFAGWSIRRSDQWKAEPDVGRVVNGLPPELDGRLSEEDLRVLPSGDGQTTMVERESGFCLEDPSILLKPLLRRLDTGSEKRETCKWSEDSTEAVPPEAMREMQEYSASSTSPQRQKFAEQQGRQRGSSLSDLPQESAYGRGFLESRIEKNETLRDMRTRVSPAPFQKSQDLLAVLPERIGEKKRPKALENRVNRLRGLGNAAVPQIPELIARRLAALLAHSGGRVNGH